MKTMGSPLQCPQCGGQVEPAKVEKQALFREVEVAYTAELQRCTECELELATVNEAARMQQQLADAYRQTIGLLTGEDIRRLRQRKGLSQQALAEALEVGIASIKRWETGAIQSSAMDRLLRTLLENGSCDAHTGHREFSLARIHLVLESFARHLGRPLLKKNDKQLFASKYLWYADMVAFRDLGRSLTGATYAALPYGPQLNNYRDLLAAISQADPAEAEPLTAAEEAVIAAVASAFPADKAVYAAAHRESIWQRRATGALIPYTDADRLAEVPRRG